MAESGISASELETIEKLYVPALRDWRKKAGRSRLGFVVVGEAGQGKSSLTNCLLGREQAPEGRSLKPQTSSVDGFVFKENGVDVYLWDSPGFGINSEEDERIMKDIGRQCDKAVDLMLYCIAMYNIRWPLESDCKNISTITEKFGKEVWDHCVFVLTFANFVVATCPKGQHVEQIFKQKVVEFEDQIKETLGKNAGLEKCHLDQIRAVPVGDPHSSDYHQLPGIDDWFTSFWLECTRRIQPLALPPLLRINEHRDDDSSINTITAPACSIQQEGSQLKYCVSLCDDDDDDDVQLPDDSPLTSTDEEQLNPKPNHSLRKIPLHKILQQELERENSELKEYVKKFVARRAEEHFILLKPGIGLAGLIEGFIEWIGHKRK